MAETDASWVPSDVDLTRPSAARVYDYFLGGAHNFEIDRQLADQINAMTPNIGEIMRSNRAFLRRGVRYLIDAGVTQFLDIGSGIPTVGNVHEIAQQANPEAKVIYVDVDPIAVAHSRAILEGNDRAAIVPGDLRDPAGIIEEARSLKLIDFDQPVALLVVGVLHFLHDPDDPDGIMARLRDAINPDSYLMLSHVTYDEQPPEVLEGQKLSAKTSTEIVLRSRAQISGYFGDFDLVDPGVVFLPAWRPDAPADAENAERVGAYGGLAKKR